MSKDRLIGKVTGKDQGGKTVVLGMSAEGDQLYLLPAPSDIVKGGEVPFPFQTIDGGEVPFPFLIAQGGEVPFPFLVNNPTVQSLIAKIKEELMLDDIEIASLS